MNFSGYDDISLHIAHIIVVVRSSFTYAGGFWGQCIKLKIKANDGNKRDKNSCTEAYKTNHCTTKQSKGSSVNLTLYLTWVHKKLN